MLGVDIVKLKAQLEYQRLYYTRCGAAETVQPQGSENMRHCWATRKLRNGGCLLALLA